MRFKALVGIAAFYAGTVALEISRCAGVAGGTGISGFAGAFFSAVFDSTRRCVTVAEVFRIAACAVCTGIIFVFTLTAASFIGSRINTAFLRICAGFQRAVFLTFSAIIQQITVSTAFTPSSALMLCFGACTYDRIALFPASVVVARIRIAG